MSIWNKPISLEILNATSKNTLIEHLNIIYTEVTENSISATILGAISHINHLACCMVALRWCSRKP